MLFNNKPTATLHIGKPLIPDKTLPFTEAVDKMQKDAYHIMQVQNGINSGDPTYNTNLNIDEYKSTIYKNLPTKTVGFFYIK